MSLRKCEKCERMLDQGEFYTTNRKDKYPDGRLNMCKKCLTMHIDNWEPETYKWILQECDVPYIKEKWDNFLRKFLEKNKPEKITGVSIIGKYLASMKIRPWGDKRWADTEAIAEKAKQEKIFGMKAQGYSDEDIEEDLAIDRSPEKPEILSMPQEPVETPTYIEPEEEEDEFSSQLTDKDKTTLRLKWGRGYRAEEWVKLEQLYNDFLSSYDIQSAGHKDTLIMVCKASLKANQLFDAGDVEGAQKMTRIYNDLMKSGNFQAVQNKEAQGEGIDSIGEIVRICEQEGFIPRFYTSIPQDKVDQTLLDIQHYTKTLVTEELNLGNMIESALIEIEKDREKESQIIIEDKDDEEEKQQQLDDELFTYKDDHPITDRDYQELFEHDQELLDSDEQFFKELK